MTQDRKNKSDPQEKPEQMVGLAAKLNKRSGGMEFFGMKQSQHIPKHDAGADRKPFVMPKPEAVKPEPSLEPEEQPSMEEMDKASIWAKLEPQAKPDESAKPEIAPKADEPDQPEEAEEAEKAETPTQPSPQSNPQPVAGAFEETEAMIPQEKAKEKPSEQTTTEALGKLDKTAALDARSQVQNAEPEKPKPAQSIPPQPKPKKPKRFWRIFMLAVILVVLLFGAYWTVKTIYMNNDTFDITFYRVGSNKLRSNMRTVVISDLHMSEYGARNADLLDAIKRLEPDFISVVGDTNTQNVKGGADFVVLLCKELVKIAPTYYALGNHEVDIILSEDAGFKNDLTDTGVILLNNKVVTETYNGNTVTIGGMTQRYAERATYAPKLMEQMTSGEGYRILLTHYPISFTQGLQYEEIDLAVCGHAHGGQIRLPFLGALYTPDQGLLPKLTEGQHTYDYMNLIISRGLGNSGNIPRINNRPELVVIDMSTY